MTILLITKNVGYQVVTLPNFDFSFGKSAERAAMALLMVQSKMQTEREAMQVIQANCRSLRWSFVWALENG